MNRTIKKLIAGILILASFVGLSVTVTGCGGGGGEEDPGLFEEYYGCPNAKKLPWYKAHCAQTHKARKLRVR